MSNVHGRILDISIGSGGASLDCLVYEGSSLFCHLENGLLKPGLCLFGDNAYINTQYMATPYKNIALGPKDTCNFYHSQLRIRVECAFVMLTKCWSILRALLPIGIGLEKSVALVNCLAKLHNYCVDKCNHILEMHPRDEYHLMTNDQGYVLLET